jgi:hypothetical protein
MPGGYEYVQQAERSALIPQHTADPEAYLAGLDAERAEESRLYAATLDVPSRQLQVVTGDPDRPSHMRVKRGAIDLASEKLVGCVFLDPAKSGVHYRLDNISERDIEFPEKVQADLHIINHEEALNISYRVRLGSHLREASHVTWDFIGDHSRQIKTIGGVATGAAVGVMTLYAIRKKRSHE